MADGEHTGGMLALVPDRPQRLAVDGGEAPGELHLTLLFLGDDVSEWGEGQADRLRELVAASAPALDAVEARIIGPALFNPDGGPDGNRDPCLVLLVSDAPELGPLRKWAQWVTTTHDDYPDPPEQFEPYIPHITLAVAPNDQSGVSADGIYTGPVRFGTLRLALAGDVHDFPLGQEAPVITEMKTGEITFTPPQNLIDAAMVLPGPVARVVAEGKALNSRGVDWVAENCGDAGAVWAADMRARAGEIETKRASDEDVEVKRNVSTEERDKLREQGHTLDSDSDAYPIKHLGDLDNGIKSYGRAKPEDRPKLKRHLKSEAKRLKASQTFHDRIDSLETATTDGSGSKTLEDGIEVKIASPDPRAARLRDEWAHNPKLTKKWRPGTPGDFKRLRRHLAKYVHTPRVLNGLTANIHKLATGEWPGKNAHTGKGNVGKSMNMGRTVGVKSLVDWDEVEVKSAPILDDAMEAALFEGIEQWGEVFAEAWTGGYVAALEESDTTPDTGVDDAASDVIDTARHASIGATMVADAAPVTNSVDQLFDAEPAVT